MNLKRTMDPDFLREVRWRIAMQFLIWATKIAPSGDTKGHLISALLKWVEDDKDHRRDRLIAAE